MDKLPLTSATSSIAVHAFAGSHGYWTVRLQSRQDHQLWGDVTPKTYDLLTTGEMVDVIEAWLSGLVD